MQKSRPIQAELVEFECEECGQGVFRVDTNRSVIETVPAQWPHICTHCNCECYIAYPFPMVKFKNQEFVLGKHVKHLKAAKK